MTYHYAKGHYLPKFQLKVALLYGIPLVLLINVCLCVRARSPEPSGTARRDTVIETAGTAPDVGPKAGPDAGARVPRVPTDTAKTSVRDTLRLEEVQINTGYQRLSPLQSTGAVDVVGQELLNRSASPNILDRIENLTTGISFKTPRDGIVIRGRASIFSDVSPLIVLDNFPYDGDIGNINPNDIASVTILKDAAAASIWGARAANGVIVITTRRGTSSKPTVSANTVVTHTQRPDPRKLPVISSADYVELERYLFGRGFYAADLSANDRNLQRRPFTPGVEALIAHSGEQLSDAELDRQLADLATGNVYEDLHNHFYREGLQQQHALNVSGDNGGLNYYFAAGYDRNASPTVGLGNDRLSLKSRNRFRITEQLSAHVGITYTQTGTRTARNAAEAMNLGGKRLYPYARLVDGLGNAMPVPHTLRSLYTDTAGGGALLDWKYYPFAEIREASSNSSNRENLLTAGFQYGPLAGLTLQATYQYLASSGRSHTSNPASSFYTRHLINSLSVIGHDGNAVSPVPYGDIVDQGQLDARSHQGRVQADYQRAWGVHSVRALAGWEIKHLGNSSRSNRLYGYREDGSLASGNLDFSREYVQYQDLAVTRLDNPLGISRISERFLSAFANASYAYHGRYLLSATVREDAANLFGVSTNMRGTPHWSVGAAWHLHAERFWAVPALERLTLRGSYGRNGNVSRQVSALTTIQRTRNSFTGEREATIVNPPNSRLRWENVGQLNLSLDFAAFDDRVQVAVSHYRKRAKDLMAQAPIDPTLGLIVNQQSYFFGNLAHMAGSGWDLELRTINIARAISWQSSLLFSYTDSRVTHYLMPAPTVATTYVNFYSVNPIVGKPVYSAYAYRWAGLDGETGAPAGYLNGEPSVNHQQLISRTTPDELHYSGSQQPTYFGAMRNTLQYRGVALSFNISFKGGYFFRRSSVQYGTLYSSWTGHADYADRWQQPGDEQRTQVPARMYPASSAADAFYAGSEPLTERGDHIRFEDLTVAYSVPGGLPGRFPIRNIRLQAYASQLGLLWTANGRGVDPIYNTSLTSPLSLAFGLQFSL